MEKIHKLKNLYDLRYDKLLNYQNVWLVLLGTLAIMVWFQDLDLKFQIVFLIKLFSTFVILLMLFHVIKYYRNRLNDLETGIERL